MTLLPNRYILYHHPHPTFNANIVSPIYVYLPLPYPTLTYY